MGSALRSEKGKTRPKFDKIRPPPLDPPFRDKIGPLEPTTLRERHEGMPKIDRLLPPESFGAVGSEMAPPRYVRFFSVSLLRPRGRCSPTPQFPNCMLARRSIFHPSHVVALCSSPISIARPSSLVRLHRLDTLDRRHRHNTMSTTITSGATRARGNEFTSFAEDNFSQSGQSVCVVRSFQY